MLHPKFMVQNASQVRFRPWRSELAHEGNLAGRVSLHSTPWRSKKGDIGNGWLCRGSSILRTKPENSARNCLCYQATTFKHINFNISWGKDTNPIFIFTTSFIETITAMFARPSDLGVVAVVPFRRVGKGNNGTMRATYRDRLKGLYVVARSFFPALA